MAPPPQCQFDRPCHVGNVGEVAALGPSLLMMTGWPASIRRRMSRPPTWRALTEPNASVKVQTSVSDLVFAEEVSKFNSSESPVFLPVFAPGHPISGQGKHDRPGW